MNRVWLSAVAIAAWCALSLGPGLSAQQANYRAIKTAIYRLQSDELSLSQPRRGEPTLYPYGPPSGPGGPTSQCWAHSGCAALGGCDIPKTFLPSSQDKTRAASYAWIADYVVVYERALTSLGYPRSVWDATLNDFEAYEVARTRWASPVWQSAVHDKYELYNAKGEGAPFNDILFKQIQAELKTYQATHPQLHGLILTGGCGGGEIPVKITTTPLATQLFIIPTFYYEVCRAQGVSPDNMTACDHWREVLAPIEDIAGSYHYFVRWADGAVRRGVLDITHAPQTGNGLSITLRKP